jgi:hypothetical protein
VNTGYSSLQISGLSSPVGSAFPRAYRSAPCADGQPLGSPPMKAEPQHVQSAAVKVARSAVPMADHSAAMP